MRRILIAACALLTGCAAAMDNITLTASPGQQPLTRDGVPALISKKKHIVMLRPSAQLQQSSGRPSFVLAVHNQTKSPLNFKASEITASAMKPDNNSLHVYSYEELVKEAQIKRNTQLVLAALSGAAGALSAANAGYSHTSGTYTGSTYGTYSGAYSGSYSGNTFGSYSATTYNAAAAQAAADANAARTQASISAIQSSGEAALSRLATVILKDHTLLPDEWHGGVIVIDVPKHSENGVAEYLITVTVGGEKHTFNVGQQRTS